MSPSSFTYKEAATFTSRYDAEAEKLMQAILNREKFSYNPETDPLYGSYKKQYTREGQRATQDAIGTAAAATGGIPSSYAVTAATQAGDYYAAQMADKVPELEQLAYSKYMNDYQMKLSDLDMIRAAEQNDYARFLDQLEQHNADRSFAYGQHLDEIDSQTAERAEALERALMAAQYGDYSFLEKMGVTPDLTEKTEAMDLKDQLAFAEAAAKQGDSSFLKALGIIPGRDEMEPVPDPNPVIEPVEPPKMSDTGVAEYIKPASEEAYTEMLEGIDAMLASGNTAEEIMKAVDALWSTRQISQEQYMELKRRVLQGGRKK
jgi:hypothetical protein